MKTENQLINDYLEKLNKALGQIPVSDRADIITELRSHIMDARDTHPEQTIDQILTSLGEPELVANRYLLERGLKPVRPPRAPVVKYLVQGFLGTMALFVFFVMFLIWKFTPFISVERDSETGEKDVSLLGGLIHIDGADKLSDKDIHFENKDLVIKRKDAKGNTKDEFRIKGLTDVVQSIGGSVTQSKSVDQDDGSKSVSGTYLLSKHATELKLNFNNGTVDVTGTSKTGQIDYECLVNQNDPDPQWTGESQTVTLTDFTDGQCTLKIPAALSTTITGQNGIISLNDLKGTIRTTLEDGQINFKPAQAHNYRYNVAIEHGMTDTFKSADTPAATDATLKLGNGLISLMD